MQPIARSARLRNSGPFAASRTAAVATPQTSWIRIVSQRTRKRWSAASALTIASSGRSPLIATPRPSPHKAFSLKVGVGARDCDSYATRRTEFEPMSTIAKGSPGNRPGAELSVMNDPDRASVSADTASIRRACAAPLGRSSVSALPRPERLGLVMKYLCALNGSSPSAATIRSLEPSGRMRKLCWLSIRFACMICSSTCS